MKVNSDCSITQESGHRFSLQQLQVTESRMLIPGIIIGSRSTPPDLTKARPHCGSYDLYRHRWATRFLPSWQFNTSKSAV